jgi:hypothetical protein
LRAIVEGRYPEGTEDYITEVVAAVLDADAVEGGRLVHEVLRTLYKIEIDGDARVRTQQEYPDRVAGQSLVDMEVRTPTDVVCLLLVDNLVTNGIVITGCSGNRSKG